VVEELRRSLDDEAERLLDSYERELREGERT